MSDPRGCMICDAPQKGHAEPTTTFPYHWFIPPHPTQVEERMRKVIPDWCGECGECLTASGADIWFMLVCASCGNKRCPHAASHRNECTRSNASGQPGSSYPAPSPSCPTEPERDAGK